MDEHRPAGKGGACPVEDGDQYKSAEESVDDPSSAGGTGGVAETGDDGFMLSPDVPVPLGLWDWTVLPK